MRFKRLFSILIILSLVISIELLWEHPTSAAATEVAGDVWGTWAVANSPYYLVDNVTIPCGKTLVIEPGVVVIANDTYKILVEGTLFANGTFYDDISFQGNSSKPTTYKWVGIIFNKTGTGVLQNCSIRDAVSALELNNAKNVKIIDSNIYYNYYGVYLGNNSNNNTISMNDIYYNQYGIYSSNCTSNEINNTQIYNNYIVGSFFNASTNNMIFSSTISNNYIGAQFLGNSKNNTIYGSYIGNNGYNDFKLGLLFDDNSRNNSVLYTNIISNSLKVANLTNSNILISNCWITGEVNIINSDNLTINYTTLYWSSSTIQLNSVANIEISNNTINTYYPGILINGNSRNIVIKYNEIYSSDEFGIWANGASDIIISNCSIQNSQIGIYLNSSNNIKVQNSWLFNNDYGISLYKCMDTQIFECEINSSGVQGISIHHSSKTAIDRCKIKYNDNNGIYLNEFSNESKITNTIIIHNDYYGFLTSGNCYDITILNCTLKENYIGMSFNSPVEDLDIRKCKINYNKEHGIYTNIQHFSIFDSEIYNNYATGIYSNFGLLEVENCNLMNNNRALTLNAYYLNTNVTVYLLNTYYNSEVRVLDDRSIVYTGWSLDIIAETVGGAPVAGADISLIPQSGDVNVTTQKFKTNSAGRVQNTICYESTRTSRWFFKYNPYTIEARKTGVGVGSEEISVTNPTESTVTLQNYDLKVTSLKISKVNSKVPVNEIFNVTAKIENLANRDFNNILLQFRIIGNEINRTFARLHDLPSGGSIESSFEAQSISQPGKYTASVQIDIDNEVLEIDEENNELSTQFSVHERPIAVLVANNTTPYVGDNITFYANGSYSPVAILEYIFDFDDGWIIKERLNSIVQHKFEKVGKYEVSLMLLDVDGISSYKDFVTIEVLPRPKPIILPVARFTISPSTGDVNTDFLFDTSDSTTGPGTTIVDYDWWFGDNITSAYESPIHRYSDDGVYTIKLKITDSQGQFSEVYQQTLIVYNLAPSILLSVDKNRVLVGEEVTFNASSTFDFDDTLTEPLTRLIWDFGDNSSYSESPIKYPDGKFDKITTHVYSEPGNYIISVEIFDDDGESNKTSINITVIALDTPEKDDSEPLIFNHGFIIAMIILFCLLILIVFIVFYNRRNRYHPQDKDYKAYEEGAGARAEGYEYYPDYGEGGAKAEYGISAAIGAADVGKKKKGAKRDSTKAKKHVSSSKPSPRKSRIESIRPVVVDVEVPEEKVVDWRDEASAVNHTLTMSDIQVVTNGDLSDASIIRMEDEPEEEFEEIFDAEDAELQGLEPEPELEFEEEFEEEFDELEEEPEFEPVEQLELEAETEQELETTEGVTFEEVFDEQAEIEEEGLEGEPEVEPEAGAEEDEEETLVFEFDDEGEHITTELHPTHEDSATEKRVKHKKGERLIPIPGVGFVTKDELKSAMGEKLDERPYSGSTPTPEVVRYDEDGFGLRCKTCLRPIRGKFIKIRRKGEETDGKQFVPIGPFCSPECAARFEKQW